MVPVAGTIAVIVAISSWLVPTPSPTPGFHPPADRRRLARYPCPVRIATWNVDSIRARLDAVTAWIDVNQPDVLALQETKVAARSFPRAPFLERGYELAVGESDGTGGVALASRCGIDDVVVGIPGAVPPLAEPRSISATCGPVRVHTVYAPNGRKVGTRDHEIKLAWLALFRAWLEIDGCARRATVVVGDLNIAPTDLDVWEPGRYRKRNLTSPPERAAFERLVALGLVDVVRVGHGRHPVFTWWNRRGDFFATDRGWRLDHALVDTETAALVRSARVDRAERARPGASDHAPVVVDLDLDAGAG